MKKVITLFIFVFSCQFSLSQVDTKKPIFEANAKKDLQTLNSIVNVQTNQEQAILDFFIRKQKQYSVYTLTPEYRKEILINYEAELKQLIDAGEVSKLNKNKKILLELISDK